MIRLTVDICKGVKLAVLGGAFVLAINLVSCKDSPPPANTSLPPRPAPSPETSRQSVTPVESAVIERRLQFNHETQEHKLNCSFCHQRVDSEPTPRFPGHAACGECHQKDFTSTTSQMCIVCHKAPLEAEVRLIDFPGRMVEFGLKGFSHKQHLNLPELPAGARPLACSDCHRFDRGGIDPGFPRHPECYNCHTHEAGQQLGECGTCHATAAVAMKYDRGVGTPFTLYNFKHGTHIKHARCERCHRTTEAPAKSARPDILQINTSRGQKHSSGCWSCHVKARESVCTKCHRGPLPF